MPSLSTSQPAMSSEGIGLEPVKVFTDLSNKIAATKRHFEDYSSGVSKLLKLKASSDLQQKRAYSAAYLGMKQGDTA